jgi:hypothetical protein
MSADRILLFMMRYRYLRLVAECLASKEVDTSRTQVTDIVSGRRALLPIIHALGSLEAPESK